MSYNLYKRFLQLMPDEPTLVGTVIEVQTGRVVVGLPDGGVVNVHGAAEVGQRVFIRAGAVQGLAPNIETVLIEI